MSVSQKDAVFSAVNTVLDKSGHSVNEMTREERSEIVGIITSGLISGSVSFSDNARSKYDTPEKIREYAGGLVTNWLRKDTRLNGGEKYTPKNPGSRAGSGDEVLKNLKVLRMTTTDAEKISAIDEAIAARSAELATAKASSKRSSINLSVLPQELLSQLNLS